MDKSLTKSKIKSISKELERRMKNKRYQCSKRFTFNKNDLRFEEFHQNDPKEEKSFNSLDLKFKLADEVIKLILKDIEQKSEIWMSSNHMKYYWMTLIAFCISNLGAYMLNSKFLFGILIMIFSLILAYTALNGVYFAESGFTKAIKYFEENKEGFNRKLSYHNLRVEARNQSRTWSLPDRFFVEFHVLHMFENKKGVSSSIGPLKNLGSENNLRGPSVPSAVAQGAFGGKQNVFSEKEVRKREGECKRTSDKEAHQRKQVIKISTIILAPEDSFDFRNTKSNGEDITMKDACSTQRQLIGEPDEEERDAIRLKTGVGEANRCEAPQKQLQNRYFNNEVMDQRIENSFDEKRRKEMTLASAVSYHSNLLVTLQDCDVVKGESMGSKGNIEKSHLKMEVKISSDDPKNEIKENQKEEKLDPRPDQEKIKQEMFVEEDSVNYYQDLEGHYFTHHNVASTKHKKNMKLQRDDQEHNPYDPDSFNQQRHHKNMEQRINEKSENPLRQLQEDSFVLFSESDYELPQELRDSQEQEINQTIPNNEMKEKNFQHKIQGSGTEKSTPKIVCNFEADLNSEKSLPQANNRYREDVGSRFKQEPRVKNEFSFQRKLGEIVENKPKQI